jgi:hypothetical protein
VSEGDILQVELDAVPTAKGTVEIVVSYSDVTEDSISPVELGGEKQFLYVGSDVNNEIKVIDLDTESIVDTISNVVVKRESSFVYRHKSKSIFLLTKRSDSYKINADSGSNNFNQKTTFSLPNLERTRDSWVYIEASDIIIHQDANKQIYINPDNFNIDKKTERGFTNTSMVGGSIFLPNRILAGEFYGFADSDKIYSIGAFGRFPEYKYNVQEKLIFGNDDGNVNVFDAVEFNRIANINGILRARSVIDIQNNILIAVSTTDNDRGIVKIDCASKTFIGKESNGKFYSDAEYSLRTGLIYAHVKGTDKIDVIDASNIVGNLVIRQITATDISGFSTLGNGPFGNLGITQPDI